MRWNWFWRLCRIGTTCAALKHSGPRSCRLPLPLQCFPWSDIENFFDDQMYQMTKLVYFPSSSFFKIADWHTPWHVISLYCQFYRVLIFISFILRIESNHGLKPYIDQHCVSFVKVRPCTLSHHICPHNCHNLMKLSGLAHYKAYKWFCNTGIKWFMVSTLNSQQILSKASFNIQIQISLAKTKKLILFH